MRLGVSAFAWTRTIRRVDAAMFAVAREAGCAVLEISMFEPEAVPVEALKRAFAESGLACTICCLLPEGINPISPEAEVRGRAQAHLRRCVETAAELGAEVIGGPMYAPIGYLPGHRATGEEWKWAAEAFAGLGGLLEQAGMTLALEPVNRAETFFLRTAAEAARLVEAIGHPQVGVTIDTFHANVEEKSLVAAIELLGPRLRHVHASENDRGLLGSGHVDFAGMYGALRRVGFEGCVVVEGFGYSPAEGDAPGFLWADEEVSPERMAREGVAFLEGLSGRGRTVEVELAR